MRTQLTLPCGPFVSGFRARAGCVKVSCGCSVLGNIFQSLANWLNELENHRTATEYEVTNHQCIDSTIVGVRRCDKLCSPMVQTRLICDLRVV